MKIRFLMILVATVALIACGKGDKKSGDDKGAAKPETGKAPAAPFTGTLDEERLHVGKDGIKPFMTWDVANAHLLATVGKPHITEGTTHYWYVLDGDNCHELAVENANGEVGAVLLGISDKAMKSTYDKCLAHGGGTPGKKEPGKKAAGDDKAGDNEGGW